MIKKLSMQELNRMSAAEFEATNKFPYVLVLDDVRSMLNVGSVFRTADAFRAEKLVLCGITGTPPHREISKTALGADETVTWEYADDVLVAIQQLKDQNFVICAIEQVSGSVSLLDFVPEKDKKYAFVLGNEVFGVNETVVKQADICIEIPQFGTKHSLNIAVTAGIICWDFLKSSTI